MAKGHEMRVEAPIEVLKAANITPERFRANLRYIAKVVGKKTPNIIQPNYRDIGSVLKITWLASALKHFERNPSLQRLVNRLENKDEFESHMLTLWFAQKVLSNQGKIEFEPDHGDIKFVFNGHVVHFECKQIEESQDLKRTYKEHVQHCQQLKKMVDDRFQYDIKYYNQNELENLGKLIAPVIPNLKYPGGTRISPDIWLATNIRQNGDVKSQLELYLQGYLQDPDTGDMMPMTLFLAASKALSLIGPKMNEEKRLFNTIGGGRKQLDRTKPSILVLEISNVMGNRGNMKHYVQTLFKPKVNTRLSAIVLLSYMHTPMGFDITLQTVRNPYCMNPLPETFYSILREKRPSLK